LPVFELPWVGEGEIPSFFLTLSNPNTRTIYITI